VKLDWDKIEGLSATLGKNSVCSNYSPLYAPYTWQCVQGLKPGSRAVFTQPPLPFKCPGAPQKIVYPDCPNKNARGKVLMRAVVGSDGSVSRAMVLTGNRSLAVAAAKAISEWRYAPFSGGAKGDSGKNVDPQKLERETNIAVSFISSDVVAISFPGLSSNVQ